MSNTSSIKITYLDNIRVFAMVMVICNHCFGYYSVDYFEEYFKTDLYYLDIFLNTITRCNVPLCLMISGGLLLGNKKYYSIESCIKKTFGIIRLLLIWIPIYIIANSLLSHSFDYYASIRLALSGIGGAHMFYGHLWYLYCAALLYAITPFLNRFISDINLDRYFLVLWLTFGIAKPLILHYIPKNLFQPYLSLDLVGGYVGYYVLGYILKTMAHHVKLHTALLLTILGFIGATISMVIVNQLIGADDYMQSFLSPFIILMSCSIFVLFKDHINKSNPIIQNLSSMSLGIYLVHFFIRDIIRLLFGQTIGFSYLYLWSSPVIVFIICYVFVFFTRKCSFINKYLYSI